MKKTLVLKCLNYLNEVPRIIRLSSDRTHAKDQIRKLKLYNTCLLILAVELRTACALPQVFESFFYTDMKNYPFALLMLMGWYLQRFSYNCKVKYYMEFQNLCIIYIARIPGLIKEICLYTHRTNISGFCS
jgi:hypothetical protein